MELRLDRNPEIRARDVGKNVLFVADPMIIQYGETTYIFAEVKESRRPGYIGVFRLENNSWVYDGPVLRERFHLSYPSVFRIGNEWYMIPESSRANAIRLYMARDFPRNWVYIGDLIEGRYVDPTFIERDGVFYIFAGHLDKNVGRFGISSDLHLFYSRNIRGPWLEHPMSPIVSRDPNRSRPGGILEMNGDIYRVAQDSTPFYGMGGLRFFRINELTPETYSEEEVMGPVFGFSLRNARWVLLGVHTFGENGNFCVYDGLGW